MKGAIDLDVGCGAGCFSKVVLDSGAMVVSLDYSSEEDACYGINERFRANHAVVQGDIYKSPFKSNSFNYVYCFGVLQHIHDVRTAFLA